MVQKKKIAVIDDDENVRLATHGLLRSFGFSVQTYASAEEFLQVREDPEPHCIVSDVCMPGMSGFELYAHVETWASRPPFVFITARDENLDVRIGDRDLHILRKPFDARSLVSSIEEAMAQSS